MLKEMKCMNFYKNFHSFFYRNTICKCPCIANKSVFDDLLVFLDLKLIFKLEVL